MNGNKIIATLVVLLMAASTMVVINKLNINLVENATAQPGVDEFGNATTEIIYGTTYASGTIKLNTTLWADDTYYLYYPTYECGTTAGNPATDFTWDGPYTVGDINYQVQITSTGIDEDLLNTGGYSITFNRSGMYVFDDETIDDHTDFVGYIWVNSSTEYTISGTATSDFTFGDDEDKTVIVKDKNGDNVGCMISIINPDGTMMYHNWVGTGEKTFGPDNFTMAGDYMIMAYRDLDAIDATYLYGDENGNPYNETYGSINVDGTGDYTYAVCGPWDPPERNATTKTLTVDTAKPTMVLNNATLFWGYGVNIDVNVTQPDGMGLDVDETQYLFLRKSSSPAIYYETDFTDGAVDFVNKGDGNYTIEIDQFTVASANDWALLANGTWYLYFAYDDNADGNEEWNSSTGSMNKIIIKSSSPPVQLKIANDGSGSATDKKVNIPLYTATSGVTPIITIEFNITGTSISDEGGRLYYGDDAWEDAENISVTGDILFPADDTTLTWISGGTWECEVTPVKPGGKITIEIDWPGSDNGTATETINIINGTMVTPAFDSFAIGENITLSVTVKDMDGDFVKNANVYLIWEEDNDEFNDTTGDNTVGNGRNGEYSFLVDTDQQGDMAPKNLTIAVQDKGSGFWGYAKVVMDRRHSMRVNVTPVTAYAGDAIEYDITVTLLEGGSPDEDSNGGLRIMIYNETFEQVTDSDIVSGTWPITGDATVTDREIILAGGTYYLYAYNDTDDSQGYNATITVSRYAVTSSPSVLAWLIDTSTNLTFQVTPAVTGTLTLINMTSSNGTWLNEETIVDIEDGIGTLEEINATDLGNVTYIFNPEGGEDRKADGLLRVTTATAVATPATIYLNEPMIVTIEVTHPATGEPLEDVRVSLDNDKNATTSILAKIPDAVYTDEDGIVQFALTAEASGEVLIFMENGSDEDNEFVIEATARKAMTLTVESVVNEGESLTVTAKDAISGAVLPGVMVIFGGTTMTTGSNGQAQFTAPTVEVTRSFNIEASKEGYYDVTQAVTVVNVPKLYITIAPGTGGTYDEEKNVYSGPIKVIVSDDLGNTITAATVTITGPNGLIVTGTTDENGVANFDVQVEVDEGTYSITATKSKFTAADPLSITIKKGGVPGFEALALLAALGVAFILFRRRRN